MKALTMRDIRRSKVNILLAKFAENIPFRPNVNKIINIKLIVN